MKILDLPLKAKWYDMIESGSGLPLRMMNELLGDLSHAIEQDEGCKIKITINVEKL